MKIILLFCLLIPLNIYAQEESCEHDHGLVGKELSELIDWFGAKDKQIQDAPCKSKFIPNEKKMLEYIEKKIPKKTIASKTVRGITFKDENPALIEAFKDFATLQDSIGFSVQDKQKDLQKEFQIAPDCNKVLCALKKIWGDNATKMLYIKLKHNYNTSDLAFENSTRFSNKELDDVLLGLEDIPDHLVPIGRPNQRLTRFTEGYTLKNYGPGVVANAVIMLFDPWKGDSGSSRQYTIFHEVAHNMASRLNEMDYNPQWLKQSSWVKKGDEWSSGKDACFPSKYSATNPAEDFAETATTYRYNGKGLKENCPEKYDFMKKHVFKGIEYTDEKLCSPLSTEQISFVRKQVGKDLIALLSSKEYSQEEINEHCKEGFKTYPAHSSDVSACALQIQLKTNLRPQIKRAMESLGVEDTGFQEDLFVKTLMNDLQKDELFIESVKKKTTALNERINALTEEGIKHSLSKPISPEAFEIHLIMATRSCGAFLFSAGDSELVDCYVKDLIAQDESNRSWKEGFLPDFKPPAFFSKDAETSFSEIRTRILTEAIKKNPKFIEKQQEVKKDFRFALERHFKDTSQEIKKLPNWKSMEPKEFCETSYGKASLWLSSFGLKSGQKSQQLIDKCISIQAKKEKRFELNSSHVKEVMD